MSEEKLRFSNYEGVVEWISIAKGNLACMTPAQHQEINMCIIEKGLVGIWHMIKDHPDDGSILTKSLDFLAKLLILQSDRESVSDTFLEDAALLKTALSLSSDTSDDECQDAWKAIAERNTASCLRFQPSTRAVQSRSCTSLRAVQFPRGRQ